MASLQFSSMWQARNVHKYYLSFRLFHKQQQHTTLWIGNIYRSPTCNFSKSSGPVRYIPRSIRLPNEPPFEKQDEHKEHGRGNHHSHSHSYNVEETYEDFPRMSQKTQQRCEDAAALHRNLSVIEMSDSCHDLAEQKGKSLEGTGIPFEEEKDTFRAFMKTQHTAEQRGKSARHLQRSSAGLVEFSETSMKTQQARAKDLGSLTGLIDVSGKLHDLEEEKTETGGENYSFLKEKNVYVKREASPQADEGSLYFCKQGKTFVKREPALEGGKPLNRNSSQDVHSFLLKVQKAKGTGLEPPGQSKGIPHNRSSTMTHMEDSFCIDDEELPLFHEQETLDEGQGVSNSDSRKVDSNSTAAQEHAKNQAIRYLAMRPYTAFQLRKKLQSRNITPKLADYALAVVQNCGMQSDLAYAETFSRARWNSGSWGPQRIRLGLKQRGVSDDVIQVAINGVFREDENEFEQHGTFENDYESNSIEMSNTAMEQLLVQATKQWNRGRNATNDTKVRRMVSWLQYRGFSYKVIRIVLNSLQQKACIGGET